jgi:hypothetical protein
MNKQIRSFFSAPEDAVKVATSRIVKLIEFRQEHVNRMLAIQQKQVSEDEYCRAVLMYFVFV